MFRSRALSPLSIAFLLLALQPHAAGAGAWLLQPGEFYSEFRGSHRSAHTAHDAEGTRTFLPFGGSREERELLSYNEIGWKKSATLVVGVPALSRTVLLAPPVGSRTKTGLSDLHLGLRVKLIDGPTAIAVQADWKAPLGYERDVFPALGAGQQDVGGQLLFGAPLMDRGFVDVAAGYRYRFEQPLDEIVGSGDLAFWIGTSFLAGGRYDYLKSVGTADTPDQKIENHLVGPRVTYRVDDRLDVFAGSSHTLAAKNAEHQNRYYVGVSFKDTSLGRLQGYLGGSRRP